MNIESVLANGVKAAVEELYGATVSDGQIQIQKTKKEFEGNLTVVIFPFVKMARKSPEEVGKEIGNYLMGHSDCVSNFNVIKGFLNLTIPESFWNIPHPIRTSHYT